MNFELTIKHFKSIKELTITLNKFNLLVGSNGSGKTNIVEAIELKYCIYKYDEHRGRWITKITKESKIEITYSLNGGVITMQYGEEMRISI